METRVSVPLRWESLPLTGGLSSRSQSASPCSTSPQNTLSQPLPTVTHKKPPRENKRPSQFFHQSWKNSSKSILFSHWTISLASFPTTMFFTRRRSLPFYSGGSLFHSQDFTYQVKNELCLPAFQTCKLPKPTWTQPTLLPYLSPFFHQTELLPNSITIIYLITGL